MSTKSALFVRHCRKSDAYPLPVIDSSCAFKYEHCRIPMAQSRRPRQKHHHVAILQAQRAYLIRPAHSDIQLSTSGTSRGLSSVPSNFGELYFCLASEGEWIVPVPSRVPAFWRQGQACGAARPVTPAWPQLFRPRHSPRRRLSHEIKSESRRSIYPGR